MTLATFCRVLFGVAVGMRADWNLAQDRPGLAVLGAMLAAVVIIWAAECHAAEREP